MLKRLDIFGLSLPGRRALGLSVASLGKVALCSFLSLTTASLVFAQTAQVNSTLPAAVERVLSGHNLPSSSYSFLVQEAGKEAGKEAGESAPLLSVNATQSMNPASTMKVITTLAALETLGPVYSWQTALYADGLLLDGVLQGDLLVKGSGDPFLVEEQLRSMLKALQRAGVNHITGNLVLDDSYFDASVTVAEQIDNQGGRAYNTNPNAILANFQAVTFYFYPHANGKDVVIRSDPQLLNLNIDNRLQLTDAACSGYQRGVSFAVNKSNPNEVIFSGKFPSRCRQYQLSREVLDAPGYTFGLFKALWQELGGELDGTLGMAAIPETMSPILVWSSSPLSDVLKSINKFSNNLMTRHLLLTLGAEQLGAPATVEKGIAVVNSYLQAKGMDPTQLHMENGAGLSRKARVTAELMNQVLQSAYRSPYMPEFLASLPLNGMDGTMRNRLQDAGMAGRMHIKTGTLDEVSAVAGYVHARSGKVYAVTGILNHELADRGPGAELMDALLAWVYTQ